MQSLAPQKSQPLVQLQTGSVGHLCLEDNLIGIAGSHGIDGHANEIGGYAASTVGLLDCEHGDVAAEGAGAVGFEFGDDDANERRACRIEGLCTALAVMAMMMAKSVVVRVGGKEVEEEEEEEKFAPCNTDPPTGKENIGRHRCCRAQKGLWR